MQNDFNRLAPTSSKNIPEIVVQTWACITALLLLTALAPHALARDPEVNLPELIPAAESAPIEHVQTLRIDIKSDSPSLARAVEKALTDQLKTIRLDGTALFRITDDRAPHQLVGSTRMQKAQKELRDRQIVTDYNNCLAHTSRTTTGSGSRGQSTTTTTETCSQWGTREVIRECVVDMQTYSGRLQLTDTRSDAVVYSRVFARAVQPNTCGELIQMTPTEFAEEFAREVRQDIAPQRTYSRSALELRRPKGLTRSEKRDWRSSKKALKQQYQPTEVAADELWWKAPEPNRWTGPNAALKQACDLYNQLEASPAGETAIVLHNRALCAEYSGELDQAETLYRRADQTLGERAFKSLRERIDTALRRVPVKRSNLEQTLAQFSKRKVPAAAAKKTAASKR